MWPALRRNVQEDQWAGVSEARMLEGHPDRGLQRRGSEPGSGWGEKGLG